MTLSPVGVLAFLVGTFGQGTDQPILRDAFSGDRLSAGWTASASPENSISVKDNRLVLKARQNTFAHISHPLGQDLVTVQCRLQVAPADSWAPSMFLYWSARNWCQLGIRSMGGGRVYMTQVVNGSYSEFNLGPARMEDWHYLRMELGKDVMRFYSSDDKVHWRKEAFSRRPSSFADVPGQVIVGKGFGGVDAFLNPLLKNDYSDKGEFGESEFSDILVTKTPASHLHAQSSERMSQSYAWDDPIGKAVLAEPEGPTFEAVAKRLPGILRPREVVGVPEHPEDIGVGADGTIQLQYYLTEKDPIAYFEVGEKARRIGSSDIPVHKSLTQGGIPLVHVDFDEKQVHYSIGIFGWSKGMSPDQPLSAYAIVNVSTKSVKPVNFKVNLVKTPSIGTNFLWCQGEVSANQPFEWAVRATRGDKWGEFEQVPLEEAAAHKAEYLQTWSRRLASGLALNTPEARVNNSYRAWLAYNYLNVDKRDGIYQIHDGSGFYEEIYAYSAFLFCNALDMYGRFADSEKYIDSLLTFQKPDGLLTINYGLPDMGTMLSVMSDHHRFTGDDRWLKRVAPNMIKACDWLIAERAKACQQPKSSVTYGLIKFRPYCDYLEPAYSYLSDTYAVVGMEAAAKEFRKIGLVKDALRIEAAAKVYREDIVRSMDRAKIVRDGLPILDLEPETHRLLNRSQYLGGEYYGLVAPSLLENGFLAPNDMHTHWITDFMEQRKGFVCGMSEFQGGVDHAYTYGYWLTCLKQGRPDRAVLGLYGSMAGAISRETYGGVEVMHVMTGEPEATLPHTYSGTQQLRLLRMMLLREEGDHLVIGQAIPRGWLKPGKTIQLSKAATLFGSVDLTYRTDPSGRKTTAILQPTFREKATTLHIWFRDPMHRAIRSVRVNGKRYRMFHGEEVILPGPAGPAKVEVTYR